MLKRNVTRTVDELGRIVLPADARRAMSISPKDEVIITWENGEIKMEKACPTCVICGSEKDLTEIGLCKCCIEKVKAN